MLEVFIETVQDAEVFVCCFECQFAFEKSRLWWCGCCCYDCVDQFGYVCWPPWDWPVCSIVIEVDWYSGRDLCVCAIFDLVIFDLCCLGHNMCC